MICHYEWHWKSKKGSSSENEDSVNLENAIEVAETRDVIAILHVKKPCD